MRKARILPSFYIWLASETEYEPMPKSLVVILSENEHDYCVDDGLYVGNIPKRFIEFLDNEPDKGV